MKLAVGFVYVDFINSVKFGLRRY